MQGNDILLLLFFPNKSCLTMKKLNKTVVLYKWVLKYLSALSLWQTKVSKV